MVGSGDNGLAFLYQSIETKDPSHGGSAVYRFNIVTAGVYVVSAVVDAEDAGSNSVFVNIDGEPMDPAMIWDIPPTNGFEERTVSWRGNGTFDTPQFAPKAFALSAGEHELIIRGRERNTQTDVIKLAYVAPLHDNTLWFIYLPLGLH
jgi:hypothetical protein